MIRNIFLSYSSKDKEKVKPVADILEKKGYNVWMDKSGKVLGGDQFKDKIIQGIKECDVVLFFSSIHSNNSEWTAKEIGYAVKEHKKIAGRYDC